MLKSYDFGRVDPWSPALTRDYLSSTPNSNSSTPLRPKKRKRSPTQRRRRMRVRNRRRYNIGGKSLRSDTFRWYNERLNTIQKRVRYIEKQQKSERPLFRKQNFTTGTKTCAINGSETLTFGSGTQSCLAHDIDQYVQTASGSNHAIWNDSGSIRQPFMVSTMDRIVLKNNANGALNVRVYFCKYKQRSNDSLANTINEDLATESHTYAATNIMDSPMLSSRFKKTFQFYKKSYFMQPGDIIQPTLKTKWFKWCDATYSDKGLTYDLNSYVIFIHFWGDVVHDTTTPTLVGTGSGKLDYIRYTYLSFYPCAGIKLPNLSATYDKDTIADDETILPEAPAAPVDVDAST